MTDDELIRWLHSVAPHKVAPGILRQAAARIEALIRERDEALKAVRYLRDTLVEYPKSVYRDARLSVSVAEAAKIQDEYEARLITEREKAEAEVERLRDLLREARGKIAYMLANGEWYAPEETLASIDATLAEDAP